MRKPMDKATFERYAKLKGYTQTKTVPTSEEFDLGLDPSKYGVVRRQQTASPEQIAASNAYVEEMRREQALAAEQSKMLGSSMPQEEYDKMIRQRIFGDAGAIPGDEAYEEFFPKAGDTEVDDLMRARELGIRLFPLDPNSVVREGK